MNDLLMKIYLMTLCARDKALDLFKKEDGDTNIIAIVLLIVIVIAVAVIFRDRLTTLVTNLWGKIFNNANNV